jgi:hypothetical protein
MQRAALPGNPTRRWHFENAKSAMRVRKAGMATTVIEAREKALLPIF